MQIPRISFILIFFVKIQTFCSFQFGIWWNTTIYILYTLYRVMHEEQWFPLNIPAFLWFQQFSAYWHDSRHILASSKTQQTSGLINIKVNLWKSLFSFPPAGISQSEMGSMSFQWAVPCDRKTEGKQKRWKAVFFFLLFYPQVNYTWREILLNAHWQRVGLAEGSNAIE